MSLSNSGLGNIGQEEIDLQVTDAGMNDARIRNHLDRYY